MVGLKDGQRVGPHTGDSRVVAPGIVALIVVLSVCANLLLLTGPIFMLQVYDRVLTSRSEQTLLVLLGLVAFLYTLYAVLEFCRTRLLARLGAAIALDASAQASGPADLTGRRLAQFLGSPAAVALLDLPWSPIFFLALFAFHPWIGATSLAGAVVLVMIGIVQHLSSKSAQARGVAVSQHLHQSGRVLEASLAGMPGRHVPPRLATAHEDAMDRLILHDLATGDLGSGFVSAARGFRLFLQSFILAVGAWLVLENKLSGGQMIAGSILLGRALAPLEGVLANWTHLMRAVSDRAQLQAGRSDMQAGGTHLPPPKGALRVAGLTVIAPGQRHATIRDAKMTAAPGTITGICGPNGCGKSLFLAALAARVPAHGSIDLGAHPLLHYGSDLFRHVGWLGQTDIAAGGTIAQTIAARIENVSGEQLTKAARDADALTGINALPQGLDTVLPLGAAGGDCGGISAGLSRRIGLARAICGDPALVLLDEPDALLDTGGLAALIRLLDVLRKRGAIVVLVTHNAAVLRVCDQRLLLENGQLVPVRPVEGPTSIAPNPVSLSPREAQA